MARKFRRIEIEPNDDGTFLIEFMPMPKKSKKNDDGMGHFEEPKRFMAKDTAELTKKINKMLGSKDPVADFMGK